MCQKIKNKNNKIQINKKIKKQKEKKKNELCKIQIKQTLLGTLISAPAEISAASDSVWPFADAK